MTLMASRVENQPRQVKVRTTYGPVTNEVIEDVGHVRHFHAELGRLIETIDAEEAQPVDG